MKGKTVTVLMESYRETYCHPDPAEWSDVSQVVGVYAEHSDAIKRRDELNAKKRTGLAYVYDYKAWCYNAEIK